MIYPRRIVCCVLLIHATFIVGQDANPDQDALQLYRSGQYESAIAITEREIAENPQNMDAYTVMGWSLLALRRFDQVIEAMQRAQERNQFDSRVAYILVEAHYSLGNFEETLREGLRYLRLTPNGSYIDQIHYFMGRSYRELGYIRNAEISFSAATFYANTNAAWWEQLGLLREQLEDQEGAIRAFEQALSVNPNRTIAQEALVRLGSQAGN